MFQTILILATLLALANADCYLHSPRGSNNRLDEANRDRSNGNRMFDSQNNNRGGTNVGSVYYYEGSRAYFEWTVQHSCGNANNHCELILQYMCDDRLRDGATTQDIPTKQSDCVDNDCDTDPEYGRQESYEHYRSCMETSRNKGLYIANQNLNNRHSAQYTRQNPAGTRNGYECPEERDYYPYWRSSPWRDIAIFTNEPTRCAAYQAHSQNVEARWECILPYNLTDIYREKNMRGFIPITQEACEAEYEYNHETKLVEFGVWQMVPSHGIAAPLCRQNQFSRDNHHGNIVGGFPMMYNWTVPADIISERCVFRLRYNISTYDMEHWENGESINSGTMDFSMNSQDSNPNDNVDPAEVPIWESFGLTRDDVAPSFDPSTNNDPGTLRYSREYVLKNDPDVDIFGSILPAATQGLVKLQINIATDQFGRTFQDRSHRFAIRSRPAELQNAIIHNVQVRGKRGNIVQVYPSIEYDFVPNRLETQVGSYVHFQWTGSNTNPNNNAGQGKAGTDRHNVVGQWAVEDKELIIDAHKGHGPSVYAEVGQKVTDPPTMGQYGTSFPSMIDRKGFMGLSEEDLLSLATLDHFGGEMSELDDAATYFDLGPRMVTVTGIWNYLSTRNNNFSNRSQKGRLIVSSKASETVAMGWEGGMIQSAGASVVLTKGAVVQAVEVTLVTQPPNPAQVEDGAISDIVFVFPLDLPTSIGGQTLKIMIPYSDSFGMAGASVKMAPSGDVNGHWIDVENVDFNDGVATVSSQHGGAFFVESSGVNVVLAVVIPLLLLMSLVGAFVGYKLYKKKQAAAELNLDSV